jgi:hypothetical protein
MILGSFEKAVHHSANTGTKKVKAQLRTHAGAAMLFYTFRTSGDSLCMFHIVPVLAILNWIPQFDITVHHRFCTQAG